MPQARFLSFASAAASVLSSAAPAVARDPPRQAVTPARSLFATEPANALLTRPTAAPRRKSLRGISVVCLGADAGARHSVKTGENAALLNRR